MTFAEPEGRPVSLDVCGSFLVVATNAGVIRVYDLSRRWDYFVLSLFVSFLVYIFL